MSSLKVILFSNVFLLRESMGQASNSPRMDMSGKKCSVEL